MGLSEKMVASVETDLRDFRTPKQVDALATDFKRKASLTVEEELKQEELEAQFEGAE